MIVLNNKGVMFQLILVLGFLFLLYSCKKEEEYEVLYPNSNMIRYHVKNEKDHDLIKEYDKNGNIITLLKFRKNQFVDTIYYYGEVDYFIKIDSADEHYFYGTQIVKYLSNQEAYRGLKRFSKNDDFIKAYDSRIKFGKELTFDEYGKVNTIDYYKIVGDSSIRVSEKKLQ